MEGRYIWIKDPDLLYDISEVYYAIRSAMSLSEKYFNLKMFAGEEISGWTLRRHYSMLEEAAKYALDRINALISKLELEIREYWDISFD